MDLPVGYCEPIPPWAKEVDLRDLSGFPLILGPPGQPYRVFIESIASAHGTVITAGAELGSVSLKHEMLRHGFFIVAPYARFLNDDNGDLAAVEFAPPLVRTMCLIFSPALPPTLRRRILDSVRGAVGARIQEGKLGWVPDPVACPLKSGPP